MIERLERRVAELEGQAKSGGPPRMLGHKSSSARKPPAQQGPRTQRRHGFARPRMTPTHRVEHVMASCPDCGTQLSSGWTHHTREVIELPVVPAQVTEHVFIARTCPVCGGAECPPRNWTAWHWGANAWASTCSAASPRCGKKGACRPQRPVVSAHRPSAAPRRGGHCERHSSDRATGPTSGGWNGGLHPRQPSGPRRRNRLASERGTTVTCASP